MLQTISGIFQKCLINFSQGISHYNCSCDVDGDSPTTVEMESLSVCELMHQNSKKVIGRLSINFIFQSLDC